ncbi:MAG: TonB-dependent receptor [Tannerella sp.]|jgi:hypothetical protein|nr:TonB-dependent receptor [Tannerella sp.]
MNPSQIFLAGAGLFALWAAGPASAQAPDSLRTQGGMNREMVLEREYKPTVADADKVNSLPAVREPQVTHAPIDYATVAAPVDPARVILTLPADSILSGMQYNTKRGYLNLGAGSYLNLNGDFGYHLLSSAKDQLQIRLSHRSSDGKLTYGEGNLTGEKVKAKRNDEGGFLDYRHVFPKAALSLGGDYTYKGYNYYGAYEMGLSEGDEMPNFDRDSRQVNQQAHFKAGITSLPGANLDYRFLLDYRYFQQKYGADTDVKGLKEHSLGADLGLSAGFNGNQRIGVGGQFHYFYYPYIAGTDSADRFRNHFEGTLTPRYSIEGDNWHIQIGANLMYVSKIGDYTDSHFFLSPDVKADLRIGSKTLLYLSAGGGIRSNSRYQLTEENPYVGMMWQADPSRIPLDARLGLKSNLLPGFWFHVFGGYRITKDDYFYTVQQYAYMPEGWGNLSRPFALNSRQLFGGLELKYAYRKLVEVSLKGIYHHYSDLSGDYVGGTPDYRPYGKPKVEAKGSVMLRPVAHFSVGMDYYMATDRWAYITWNEKMKDVRELSVTGSYAFNSTFGIYVKGSNLLGEKYEYVYGYPLQGLTLMGGLNINF